MNDMDNLQTFIQPVYTNANLNLDSKEPKTIPKKIELISNQLGLETYYISFPSELNNLEGKWRIFLNNKQKQEKIWQDFGLLIGTYYDAIINSKDKRLHSPVELIKKEHNFVYYFCVPDFILQKVLPSPEATNAIELISSTFAVDKQFAAKRLEIFRAAK